MFNNAGIVGVVGRIADTPVEAWEHTVAVLLRGVFLGMKHAARVMVPQGVGLDHLDVERRRDHRRPRPALLHGVQACGDRADQVGGLRAGGQRHPRQRHLARQHGHGDDLGRDHRRSHGNRPERPVIAATSPLGVAGLPEDIANAALYLASDEASVRHRPHAGRRRGA